MIPNLLTTADLPAAAISAYSSKFNLQKVSLEDLSQERLKGVAAIIVKPGDDCSASFVSSLPQSLQAIGTYSVGVDHIDLQAAREKQIPVVNTPGVLVDATADIAFALILNLLRQTNQAESMLRQGRWKGWQPDLIFGHDLRGKPLGIFGAGEIGFATAKRAAAFGMRVHYWSGRGEKKNFNEEGFTPIASFEEFLAASDVLSLHAPLTSKTEKLINKQSIQKLPPHASIINTARGPLLNDDDVISALTTGRLGGVGLDVMNNEPDFDKRYLEFPNAILYPHIGSATEETRTRMAEVLFSGLSNILE